MIFEPQASFDGTYNGSDLYYGRGRTAELGDWLDDEGLERALVVTGRNVGANEDVMGPVREGLGDRLVDVFDETTPEKTVETAFDAIERLEAVDADVVVGLGGGGSLNVARLMLALAADGRSQSEIVAAAKDGTLESVSPDPSAVPAEVVVIPTTLAGAEMSAGGSLLAVPADESPTGHPLTFRGSVQPRIILEDPALFETTPMGPLAGSTMNGVDKAIETTYARGATPMTDALAVHSLRQFSAGLSTLGEDDPESMERIVVGLIIAQYERQTSIVHAFGHAFARRYPIQQGVAHAVVVPHVLRYLYDEVDGRREVLAEGLGIETDGRSADAIADDIVQAVTELRDDLGVPTRIHDLDHVAEADIPELAQFVLDDHAMAQIPTDLDPTIEDIEGILQDAW